MPVACLFQNHRGAGMGRNSLSLNRKCTLYLTHSADNVLQRDLYKRSMYEVLDEKTCGTL